MSQKLHVHDDPSLPCLDAFAEGEQAPATSLTLPYDARKRSRQRVCLDDGREAAIMLPRGTLLRDGDRLRLSQSETVVVKAAAETVSTVTASDLVQLARVAYHLGNRHVPLQVGEGWLRYQHDHVLDGMVKVLGGVARVEIAPFEPEGGAHVPHGEERPEQPPSHHHPHDHHH